MLSTTQLPAGSSAEATLDTGSSVDDFHDASRHPAFRVGQGNLWLLGANAEACGNIPRREHGLFPPSAAGRKLAVLDLDNTLVDATLAPPRPPSGTNQKDLSDIPWSGKGKSTLRVFLRPGAVEMIKELNSFCDVAIFTASPREIGSPKVAWLEQCVGAPFHSVLYRDSTIKVHRTLVKDLALFTGPGDADDASK